jgi:hypothetical protein
MAAKRIKNRLAGFMFNRPIQLDLEKALEVKLGASQLGPYKKEGKQEYSPFGACLQAMKVGNRYLDIPYAHTIKAMDNIKRKLGAQKVKDLQRREANPEEDLNKLRLDILQTMIDNKVIEIDTEANREKAIELGLIKVEVPTFE